jgi:phage tail sheath gpL-like
MPVLAVDNTTDVALTSKWEGNSANLMTVSVEGSTTAGTVFSIVQPFSGLNNPDVQPALDQVGEVWEMMFINCLESVDSTALDAFSTFGDGRWGALTRKPCVAFYGDNSTAVSSAIFVPDGHPTDRTNVQLVAPGSNDLLFVTAARQVARIALQANTNAPVDYGSLQALGLTPGADGDQWPYNERDLAVKSGCSTINVVDGVIQLADIITMYHPTGDPTPAYSYVVDIVKLQNIIYNLNLIFETPEWDGAPLIPDDQPTANRAARKPKSAVAEISTLIDSLGLAAIISDPDAAKETVQAEIDSQNPKRLNIAFTVQLSGNANIISIDFNFGFYFGTPTTLA